MFFTTNKHLYANLYINKGFWTVFAGDVTIIKIFEIV